MFLFPCALLALCSFRCIGFVCFGKWLYGLFAGRRSLSSPRCQWTYGGERRRHLTGTQAL